MNDIRTGHMPVIEISIDGDGWAAIGDLNQLGREAVRATWAAVDAGSEYEISILFTTDDRIRSLNAQFRNVDASTNVLAFPSDPPLIGDVALALETVLRESREHGKPVRHHVSHLLVHGILHLLGYDHLSLAERRYMEELEIAILDELGIPDPYGHLDEPAESEA